MKSFGYQNHFDFDGGQPRLPVPLRGTELHASPIKTRRSTRKNHQRCGWTEPSGNKYGSFTTISWKITLITLVIHSLKVLCFSLHSLSLSLSQNHVWTKFWVFRCVCRIILCNVGKTIINHSPVITMFIRAWLPFPAMSGLFHCFTHIIIGNVRNHTHSTLWVPTRSCIPICNWF